MSAFDINNLYSQEITEVSQKRPPIAVGDYTAILDKPTPATGESKGRTWVAMDILVQVQVPADQQPILGTEVIKLTHRVFLDLNEAGQPDLTPGKNTAFRLFREALDMNSAGKPFSWSKVPGHLVTVKISHDEYQGNIQEKITGIAKIL